MERHPVIFGKELNELYWSTAIKSFAISLIGLFEPIFVYLLFEKSVPMVALLYAGQYLGFVLLVPLASRLLGSFGLKKTMTASIPFLMLYLVSLFLAQSISPWFILLTLVFKPGYLSLYWPAYHTDLARFSKNSVQGREVGFVNVIVSLCRVAAPLLGGLVIVAYGFQYAFFLACLVLTLATLPLFSSGEVFEPFRWTWKESFQRVFQKHRRKLTFVFFCEGIEYATGIFFFPIFVYGVIGSIGTLGWLTSLSLLLSVIVSYGSGWVFDQWKKDKVISFGSLIHSISWLFNGLIRSQPLYVLLSGFYHLAITANHISFMGETYRQAREHKDGILDFVVHREIAHNSGNVVLFLLVALGFALGLNSFVPFFLLAAVAAYSFRFIRSGS